MSSKLFTTIFLPENSLYNEHEHLYGSVTTTHHDYNQDKVKEAIIVVINPKNSKDKTEPIGCCNKCLCDCLSAKHMHLFISKSSVSANIEIKEVNINGETINPGEINVIFYNPLDIGYSELLTKKFNYNTEEETFSVSYLIHHVKDNFLFRKKTLNTILLTVLLNIISLVTLVFTPVCAFVATSQKVFIKRLNYTSKFLNQIMLRMSQLEEAKQLLLKKTNLLLCGHIIGAIICDMLLGLIFMSGIYYYATVEDVHTNFREGTKVIVTNVQALLQWLSGAPAGLKLNQPLTQALAMFFSYHIYLWNLYLEGAQPVLKGLAWIFIWTGTAGISIQISILSDLLDLATLHLYCFYVYAARIHMFQISLLGAQWRAFCGKKWNPLKTRVDTYGTQSYTSLSRVLMAVIFTLVIFLLPTTTVYYLVFMLLRTVIYTIRGSLSFLVWLLNNNPVYIAVLHIINSRRIKGDVYFELVHDANKRQGNGTLFLQMSSSKPPFSEILLYTSSNIFSKKPIPNWSYVFNSILYGENLLY